MSVVRKPAARKFVEFSEIFSEMDDAVLGIASVLRGARYKAGLSQVELAKKLHITQGDLSKMERGKRSIGKVLAQRLGKILDIDYRVFL
jgi:ribosome-binding protein aMBF1 (putative translation factor)